MSEVVETLMAAGAEIVRASIPTAGWIGGPGTVMAVLNRNPESTAKHDPAHCSIVFVYEIKRDLNAYLSEWASETPIRTMADVIAFNECAAEVLPPSSIARLLCVCLGWNDLCGNPGGDEPRGATCPPSRQSRSQAYGQCRVAPPANYHRLPPRRRVPTHRTAIASGNSKPRLPITGSRTQASAAGIIRRPPILQTGLERPQLLTVPFADVW